MATIRRQLVPRVWVKSCMAAGLRREEAMKFQPQIMRLLPSGGSLIPAHQSYVEQLKPFEHQTLKAGLRNTHGFQPLTPGNATH